MYLFHTHPTRILSHTHLLALSLSLSLTHTISKANNPRIALPHSLDPDATAEEVSLNDSIEDNSDTQSHTSSVSQEPDFSRAASRRDDRGGRDRLQPSTLKKRKHKHK